MEWVVVERGRRNRGCRRWPVACAPRAFAAWRAIRRPRVALPPRVEFQHAPGGPIAVRARGKSSCAPAASQTSGVCYRATCARAVPWSRWLPDVSRPCSLPLDAGTRERSLSLPEWRVEAAAEHAGVRGRPPHHARLSRIRQELSRPRPASTIQARGEHHRYLTFVQQPDLSFDLRPTSPRLRPGLRPNMGMCDLSWRREAQAAGVARPCAVGAGRR